jgi:hypothetical protein
MPDVEKTEPAPHSPDQDLGFIKATLQQLLNISGQTLTTLQEEKGEREKLAGRIGGLEKSGGQTTELLRQQIVIVGRMDERDERRMSREDRQEEARVKAAEDKSAADAAAEDEARRAAAQLQEQRFALLSKWTDGLGTWFSANWKWVLGIPAAVFLYVVVPEFRPVLASWLGVAATEQPAPAGATAPATEEPEP